MPTIDIDQTHVGRDLNIFVGLSQDNRHYLAAYLTLVAEEANVLPWGVVGARAANPESGGTLRLADVYTELDTTDLRQVQREDQFRDLMARMNEMERIPAQEIANDAPRLLIMGDPGSGKSTFLKHLCYTLAVAYDSIPTRATAGDGAANDQENDKKNDEGDPLAAIAPWDHGRLLPVHLELRNLAAFAAAEETRTGDAALIMRYIHHRLEQARLGPFEHALQQLLQADSPRAIFLFDGLDEVPTSQRQLLVDAVNSFARLHEGQRLIVTCRPYAYIGQPWQLEDVRPVTLAPFSPPQINRFVVNWYRRLTELDRIEAADAQERSERLQEALQRDDLRRLAERPLLLTVMAQLHTFTNRLPDDRTELYANAVDLLLQRWESRFAGETGVLEQLDIPGLKLSDLQAGLYAVAFQAHQGEDQDEEAGSDRGADIGASDLRDWLAPYLGGSFDKAQQFVDYIRERAGLLIRHKNDAYTFPHRSFQEFLAACHLTAQPEWPTEAALLMRADPDRWREVFVLAAGHAARTHKLAGAIAAVNELCPEACDPAGRPPEEAWRLTLVAADALLEIGLLGVQRTETGKALQRRIQGWLTAATVATETLPAPSRGAAGIALGRLSDPRVELRAWEEMHFCYVPPGPFRMGNADDEHAPLHDLALDAGYWIGRFPVTNAQFKPFVEAGGYAEERYWREAKAAGCWENGQFRGYTIVRNERGQWIPREETVSTPFDYGRPFNLPNHPRVGIFWYAALAYTRWLTEQAQAQGLLPAGWIVTLPTEAQWEKAARGGLHIPAGTQPQPLRQLAHNHPDLDWIPDGLIENPWPERPFPWGEAAPAGEEANTAASGLETPSAPGCFAGGRSPYGVEEMSGNVWEWTRSLWGGYNSNEPDRPEYGYPYDDSDGREDLNAGVMKLRILRGGYYANDASLVGCGVRGGYNPLSRYDDVGFRVVLQSPFS